jgi:hypothetical protein
MPPPCCMVSAASFSASKMPAMLSGIVPITKQLNSVTDRPVPAPADDPARGQVFEILQRGVEPVFPGGRVGLDRGQRPRDAAPGVLDRAVDGRAVGLLEAVLHVPDLFGDRGGETGHRSIPSVAEDEIPP